MQVSLRLTSRCDAEDIPKPASSRPPFRLATQIMSFICATPSVPRQCVIYTLYYARARWCLMSRHHQAPAPKPVFDRFLSVLVDRMAIRREVAASKQGGTGRVDEHEARPDGHDSLHRLRLVSSGYSRASGVGGLSREIMSRMFFSRRRSTGLTFAATEPLDNELFILVMTKKRGLCGSFELHCAREGNPAFRGRQVTRKTGISLTPYESSNFSSLAHTPLIFSSSSSPLTPQQGTLGAWRRILGAGLHRAAGKRDLGDQRTTGKRTAGERATRKRTAGKRTTGDQRTAGESTAGEGEVPLAGGKRRGSAIGRLNNGDAILLEELILDSLEAVLDGLGSVVAECV